MDVISWTVVGHLSWQYLRAPTFDRSSRSVYSTIRRAGQLATADTCSAVLWSRVQSSAFSQGLALRLGLDSDIAFRPHRMRRIDAAYCYTCHTFRCLCLSIGHTGELCENGWTDRHAVDESGQTCVGPRKHVLDYISICATWRMRSVRGGYAALCKITLTTRQYCYKFA